MRRVLPELFEKYIKGTPKEAIVVNKTVFICHLTNAVRKGGDFPTAKVYIKTRVLKHSYDKRPAEEFHFMLENLHEIAKYPDHIYKSRASKRGDFCFIKRFKGKIFFCALEIITKDNEEEEFEGNYIVTAFELRSEDKTERYLNSYKLLWSWEGGTPPS